MKQGRRLTLAEIIEAGIRSVVPDDDTYKLLRKSEITIILISHNFTAEWSVLADRDESYITRRLALIRGQPITDGHAITLPINPGIPVKVKIFDTMLLAPASHQSLKKLSKLLGDDALTKGEVSQKYIVKMDLYLEECPEEFEKYALQDTKITLMLFFLLQDALNKLVNDLATVPVEKKFKLYRTLASAGVKSFTNNNEEFKSYRNTLKYKYQGPYQLVARSYLGGRNEGYFIGRTKNYPETRDESYIDIDFTGCYPTAMATCPKIDITKEPEFIPASYKINDQIAATLAREGIPKDLITLAREALSKSLADFDRVLMEVIPKKYSKKIREKAVLYNNKLIEKWKQRWDQARQGNSDWIVSVSIPGFAKIRFKFPPETQFPCLPIRHKAFGLLYPLEGETVGYTQAELVSMTIDQISTPEKAQGVLERIERLMTQGHLIFETAHQRKNGTIIYVEVSSRRIVWNGQLAMMSICRDITKRKATEKALSKSENRLRLALKANKNAVWDWDLGTGEFYQSPFGWGMIGHEEKEIVSSHDLLAQLMHPEDLKLANQVVREAITNGKDAFKIETRLLHKHGHYVPILKRGYIQRDDNKRAIRVSGTITDLTERKIFEETQGKLTRKLQQLEKVESLNCMAGAIAHNFNNLLGGGLGNLEIAIEDLPQEWGPSKYLTSAFQAAERAAEVSGTMLTYLGLSFVKHKHQDFSAICRDYVSALKGLIKNEQVLETDIPIHGPTISCDTEQIQRMLRSLVVNASEAIEGERGGICISLKTVSSADISQERRFPVNWHPSPKNFFACLEVKDCGSGITAKDIEKIFDPFFTSKFTGRGLGLPVVLGILQSHQGGITIESELNLGSIFRCYFPLIAEQ